VSQEDRASVKIVINPHRAVALSPLLDYSPEYFGPSSKHLGSALRGGIEFRVWSHCTV